MMLVVEAGAVGYSQLANSVPLVGLSSMVGCEEIGGSQVEQMVPLSEERVVGESRLNVEGLGDRVLTPGSVLCFESDWCLGS